MIRLPLRPFGGTGLELSPLGLGTVKIGRNEKVKYSPFELPDDRTVRELLETARDCGINLIDTAPAYGIAEERLGQALSGFGGHFRIFTKAGEFFEDGVSHYDFSREAIEGSVHGSLARLRVDRLDCVLLHCSNRDLDDILRTPALETLQRLKEQGKIASHGVSTMSVEGGMAAVDLTDVVMVAYNPGYTAELPVIEAAAARGKGILIKKGLCSGNLPAAGQSDPAAECIRAAMALPGRAVLVIGTMRPAHVRSNAALAASCFAEASGNISS